MKPQHHYSFAIDKSGSLTQKDIVEGISKGVGCGQTHNIELDDVVYEDWAEFLTLNLRMNPSTIYDELFLEEPEEESKEFPWH